ALDIEDHAAGSLVILKVDADFPDAHVANRKRRPVRWYVRREGDLTFLCVGLETQHAAQDGTDNHGCGPDLMRRTGRKGLVVVAGQNFGEMAERAVAAEQSIGAQIGVCGERAVVAVFTHGSPSGKQGPDRTKMIAGPVINF